MDQSVAIVTGAASGIGRSIAQALAQRGDRVVVADIDKAGGEAAADALDARFVQADLSQREDCLRLIAETLKIGTVELTSWSTTPVSNMLNPLKPFLRKSGTK